ncbi:MAG: hypothetical protein NC184_00550 [Roseburia sp.]|nr:hypothetical protein [Roseburia sp.]
MLSLLSADIFEMLGLDGWALLFYLGNFVILVTVLVLVLYKPVKRMLKNKRKSLDDICDENKRLKEESENTKAEYDKMVAEMKIENAKVAAEVAESAEKKAQAVLEEAQEQARAIIAAANKDAATQKEQLKTEYRDSVNRLAVQIAQKLLEREISQDDNSKLIEQVLSDWEND